MTSAASSLAALGQQLPRTTDDRGTLLDRPVTPDAEGLVRGLDGAVDGSRVEAVELPHDLPGVGVHCCVVMSRRGRHGLASSPARAPIKWRTRLVAPDELAVLGAGFIYFTDERDGRGKVLYVRHDGDYGPVEPPPVVPAAS